MSIRGLIPRGMLYDFICLKTSEEGSDIWFQLRVISIWPTQLVFPSQSNNEDKLCELHTKKKNRATKLIPPLREPWAKPHISLIAFLQYIQYTYTEFAMVSSHSNRRSLKY